MIPRKLFAGEKWQEIVDLDTSATDADYDLTGATLLARFAAPGADAAFIEVTPTVLDAEAGRVLIETSDTDDAPLGPVTLTVIDSDAPYVLAEVGYYVSPLVATPPATPEEVEATVLDVTYATYQAAGGVSIPEAQWTRYRAAALRIIHEVTLRRTLTGTDHDERIVEAIIAVADALYDGDGAVTSEKLGSYAVTYDGGAKMSPRQVARAALSGTGLTYLGI